MKINRYLLIVFVISVGECYAELQKPFLGSDNDETSLQPNFIPPEPQDQCVNSSYCNIKSAQYPQAYIDKYLENHRVIWLNDAAGLELKGRSFTNEDPRERSFCNSVTEVKPLYQVKNKYNEWYYAMQTENYKQALEVEICSFPGGDDSCESVVEPDSMKTSCMQQFTTHIVLALGHDGKAITVATKFPTCCVCGYMD